MRWTRWTAIGLCFAATAGAAFTLSCTSQAPPKAEETAASKVERGEYLVHVGSCGDCHTPGGLFGAPDPERNLSGSEIGWQGPWGVSYARNLTPDPETGLGNWSEDDIVKTIRTGQRADGSPLLPPMPWPHLAHLTDADAYAIAAYLKSLPPIQHKVPAAIPPGSKATGSIVVFPPPSAWDAPRTPPDTTGT